jgi:xanthine dehydrogenase accessory factor
VVTPGHVLDEQCLEFAVSTPARYIGMIGSKNKTKDVYERLAAKGVSPEKLKTVHAPIGLAIGAETPEEIAVSIMAEVIQHKRQS